MPILLKPSYESIFIKSFFSVERVSHHFCLVLLSSCCSSTSGDDVGDDGDDGDDVERKTICIYFLFLLKPGRKRKPPAELKMELVAPARLGPEAIKAHKTCNL